VILATKYPFGDPAAVTPEQRTDDLHASLDRLRTDHVDVLQLHGGVFDDALADRHPRLRRARLGRRDAGAGLCRFTGITAEGPSGALERLLRTERFDVIEIAYSLIYQSTCDYQREPTGIVPLAKSLNMGVTAMRPATSGFLQKLLCAAFPALDPAAVTRSPSTSSCPPHSLTAPSSGCAASPKSGKTPLSPPTPRAGWTSARSMTVSGG
jgi:predicted aldo/keto reductase-like oxidoreductase